MEELDRIPHLTLFNIGPTPVTVGSVIAALLVAAAAIILANLLGALLRRLRARVRAPASIYIVEKVATYGLVVAGLIAAVNILGVNLTSLAVFAGAVGVGVGLGLQGIVKEFVSGLVIIFEGSVQVNDYIELERGGRGEVKEVGPRATRIRNNDNVDILVPNSKLIEERVTSWTFKGAARRIHVPFSVPYGSDKNLVREVILEAAKQVPFTLPERGERRSQVWLVGFGDAGLNFELLVWPELSAVKRPNAAFAAYTWAIEDALGKAGLEIPYRQMDLHLRSVFEREGDDALKALGLRQTRHAERRAAITEGANDAAADLAAGKRRDIAAAKAQAKAEDRAPSLEPEPEIDERPAAAPRPPDEIG